MGRDNLSDSTRLKRGSLMRTRSTDTILASGPDAARNRPYT